MKKTTGFKILIFLLLIGIKGYSQELNRGGKANNKPNVVIIYTDDLGYGDLSSYGNPTLHTPELDKMATQGMKLSQFYVAAPVCTPSRAALLTGAYPKRVGLEKGVLFPSSKTGLNPEEKTIAEILKEKDYATACIGKWHLGYQEKFLPINQGFDIFYGIPFSNDMSRKEQDIYGNKNYKWQLPLMSQKDTIELDPNQQYLTKRLTHKAVDFIKKNKSTPFFLYIAHPMPHIPLYASEKFQNTSVRGKYGDTVEEIDWSVGEVLKTLKKYDLERNTLVIFTSDNGPWKVFKTDGGSAGPLRGGKGTTWEGGTRVPCIAWWPGKIPSGSFQTKVITNMDLLPTIANLCGADLPKKDIDGVDVSSALFGEKQNEESKPFLYYSSRGELQGIRKGKYKLLIIEDDTFLFDLESDISEAYNISESLPEKIIELKKIMTELDANLNLNKREVGKI